MTDVQLEADLFLHTMQEKGPDFFMLLSGERFYSLQNFWSENEVDVLECVRSVKSVISTMNSTKNRNRSRLIDSHLLRLQRLATTQPTVEYCQLF